MNYYKTILSVFLCLLFQQGYSQNTAPNVILIITDDQGYGDMSCHGNPYLKTPNIDRLYAQSTRLTDFHVSPTCTPTRAALMTGHYTNRTGAWHTIAGRSLLYEHETTLGDLFTANGYATGMFGKWHLGDNHPFRPMDRGFQHAVYHGGGGVFQGPDYWNNDYFDDTYFVNGTPKQFAGYCTDVWFDEAMDFMETQRKRDKPFFTYLATNAPHGPFWVENKYKTAFAGNEDVPNADFYGMLVNFDENMGRMLDYLDRTGQRENTLLIFMSDNGTAGGVKLDKKTGLKVTGYNAGMRGLKNSAYEGGHRVPFFISWANGKIPAGRDLTDLTAHIDVRPTLIDLLGLKSDPAYAYDGISLKSALLNPDQKLEKRTLITDSQRMEMCEKWKKSSTMQGTWRLINGEELYDIAKDPGQQKNVAKKYPKIKAELRQAYEDWWADISPGFDQIPRITLCPPQDAQTLIHSHDMHMDPGYNSVPWNHRQIRSGMKSQGWLAVEAPRSGKYKFSLYRWYPMLNHPIRSGIAAKAAIPGTNAGKMAAGVALPIERVGMSIADFKHEKDISDADVSVSFEVFLDKGPHTLRTWFQEKEGESYGAYYIQVEKI